MIKKRAIVLGIFFLFPIFCISQNDLKITVDSIPINFRKNTNIITIEKKIQVEIINQNISNENVSETVLILDQNGLSSFRSGTNFDALTKIKSIELTIYDADGKFVKKIDENNFAEASIADGFSIYNDNRVKYSNIDYKKFPFFVKLDYKKTNEFTIFISPFYALNGENDKVLNTEYTILYPPGFNVKAVEKNILEYQIAKIEEPNRISYSGKNLIAPEYEELNQRYLDLLPEVKFSIDKFSLSNIKGTANSWDEFGIWYQKNFLEGLDVLPASTVSLMKNLTKDAQTDLDKVKIIFDYVQKNTRYISIQTGIGGWKPFSAKEVDRLKYGDCKALTNYTKALLKAVDVETFYTILYASDKIRDINEDIISMQGNHVLLSFPYEKEYVFLECTNQDVPFGHLSTSTDNRKVLMISKDGSKFITTKSYKEDENLLKANFTVDLSDLNEVKIQGEIDYKGSYYGQIYGLNIQNKDQVFMFLKNQFSSFKDLKIINSQFENNKEEISYKEKVNLQSSFVGSKAGNDYLVEINPFYKLARIPKNYKKRESDFQVLRENKIIVTTKYILPDGFTLSFKPNDVIINTDFGSYEFKITRVNNELNVMETFDIKTGTFNKDKYSDYRNYLTEVQKINSSKFILTKQ